MGTGLTITPQKVVPEKNTKSVVQSKPRQRNVSRKLKAYLARRDADEKKMNK